MYIFLSFFISQIWKNDYKLKLSIFSECSKHCSLCYNETECYECTQGFFITGNGECERKTNFDLNDCFALIVVQYVCVS